MDKPPFEVADVIRNLADANGVVPGLRVSLAQQRVLTDLLFCRTARLGGHMYRCACDHEYPAYNACRNRHCPKCQGRNRAQWLEARCKDLLPVQYFHVVFTLPAELAPLALQNQKVVYSTLFAAATETLKTIAADPKHLGAEIGFIGVLHTWGQTLVHHPHVHFVVPGGGLSPDGCRWIDCRRDFFVPVRVLSRLYRGKFLAALRAAFADGQLEFHGNLRELADPERFARLCRRLRKKEWVVYVKPPFGGPEQVLKYLARYTHRVAISNHRIVNVGDDTVTFRYKDYAHGNRARTMKLDAREFLRRFLQHVLPKGFVRIRHFGFLANRSRKTKLQLCRELIAQAGGGEICPEDLTANALGSEVTEDTAEHSRCPKCGGTQRSRIGTFGPQPTWIFVPPSPTPMDTS